MKNIISKAAFLLLCSVFALTSCEKDVPSETKTATVKYVIMVSADIDYDKGNSGGGIEELYIYIQKEMSAVSKDHNKAAWTITEKADTEEAAIAACDKKAKAIFDGKIAAINTASASIKAKFDAKKTELLSKISVDAKNAHVIYKDYGGHLFKGKSEDLFPQTVVKEGTLFNMQAIGGE